MSDDVSMALGTVLRHRWDLMYIVVQVDLRTGEVKHTGLYESEMAALEAVDILSSAWCETAIAQLFPPET